MSEFFRQLQQEARKDKLSPSEKQALRVRLYNHMEHNPLQPITTLVKEGVTPVRAVPSAYYWYSPKFAMPVALILIVGLSGGTAFASQNALPGDTLYPFKVNISEQLQIALAFSEEDKAAVNASLAEVRLEEAEELAAAGKLDAETSKILAASFDAHAAAAQTLAVKLEEKNPGSAAQLVAEFDSKLLAHSAILEEVESESKANAKSNSGSLAFAERVRSRQMNVDPSLAYGAATLSVIADDAVEPQTPEPETARTMMAPQASTMSLHATASATSSTDLKTTAKFAATSSNAVNTSAAKDTTSNSNKDDASKDQRVAATLSKQASTSIQTTIKNFNKIKGSLDASVVAEVEARIAAMTNLYAGGTMALNEGNYADAKSNFTDSIKLSTQLSTYLKAGKKLNIKILSTLLGVKINTANSNSGTVKGESTEKGSNETTVNAAASTSTNEPEQTPTSEPKKEDPDNGDDTPVKVEGSIKVNIGL